MKKIFLIVAVFMVIFLNSNKVCALENSNNNNDYRIDNAGGEMEYILSQQLSEQRLKQIEAKNAKEKGEDEISTLGGGTFKSLSFYGTYPNYKQEKSYWCGPATIKQAVQWINKSSDSQSVYANSMGTNSNSGSYVYKMSNELNVRQSKHSYGYTDFSTINDKWRLWNIVKENVSEEKVPVIVHALTDVLYLYNGKNLGHYITITGYYDDHLGPDWNYFEYVDTFSADYGRGNVMGVHEVGFTELYNSLHQNGRYLIW